MSPCSATQELRGLGLANLVGAAFNCYTTTGSFSRSAIMNDVGAKTQLAGIISGEHGFRLSMTSEAPALFQHVSCFSNGTALFMSVHSGALPAESDCPHWWLGAEHCRVVDLCVLAVPLRHSWCPAGILVMIVLLCLTPVFKNMPQNAQAAVIIAAVIGLFRYDEWWFLWKVSLSHGSDYVHQARTYIDEGSTCTL